MIRAGDKIGPYTLVRRLGRGTFGVVWLAEKRTMLAATKVALKLPNDDDIDLEAIKREAEVWVEASGHPNVLPIIDADIYDEQVVIVSEYAPDGSLADWLKQHGGKTPTIEAAVEMTLSILDGLAHLHARRIIHRDLKPANILLQGKTPRLVDFGLARVLKTTGQSSNVSGTYAYMPPEAFDGKRSEQTDVWSVGVILHQMLTGRLPYPQMDDAALIGAILTREPELPPADLPQALRQVLSRSLQRNLAERYQSVVEMREALRAAVHPSVPVPTAPQDTPESELPTQKSLTLPVEPVIVAPPPIIPSRTMKAADPELPVARESQPTILPTQRAISPIPLVKSALTLPSTSKTAKRRGLLWPGVAALIVIIGLVVAASMGLFSGRGNSTAKESGTNRGTSGSASIPPLKSYLFFTVRVDANGNVTQRSVMQAQAFSEDLGGDTQLEMVKIKAGSFKMGSPASEAERSDDEGPQHQVNVPEFYMGKYEVTQAQWRAVARLPKVEINLNPDPSIFKGDNLPVEQVSWDDAQEFCARLSKATGREYRLPSEAEWEYAARAGTQTPFAFGETLTTEIANYDGNYSYSREAKGANRQTTTVVGSLGLANGFGLYDMHGNVWEWCMDWYHDNYNGAPQVSDAWINGGKQDNRVLRGGAWNFDADYLRSARRNRFPSGSRYYFIGLRLAVVAQSS